MKDVHRAFEQSLMSSDERVLTKALKIGKSVRESAPLWPPPQHCYMISYRFKKHYKANRMFNQCFDTMYEDFLRDSQSPTAMFGSTLVVVPFIWYSMFLFNVKSQNACKYFEYCLEMRPFNQYMHYYYSSYLCNIKKNYQSSYFQFKLSKMLNNSDDQDDQYKTQSKELLKVLVKKLKKQHHCSYSNCDKILPEKACERRVCKGCKSANYCNKLCQKLDWRVKHRRECMAIYSKKFTNKQIKSLKAYTHVMNQMFE